MIMGDGDALHLVPVGVEEYEADVLGPRVIDELQPPSGRRPAAMVRHLVKGFDYDQWTQARVDELEDLVCADPLASDPLAKLASGDDWVGWKTRNEILGEPGANDDALRLRLEDEIFAGQGADGSWGPSPVTAAVSILRALSVGVAADDDGIQTAAQWLLDRPEPDGRPGCWMLTDEHVEKWNSAKAGAPMTGSKHECFMVTGFTDAEHDLYRCEAHQQVIPTCGRNFHAGCDTVLHPSATAAMALAACGHAEHARVKAYANSALQLHGMFGYFCACWGWHGFDKDLDKPGDRALDFNQAADEHPIALKALQYGFARDADDLCLLAGDPCLPGKHRPDLADTNGQPPYAWQEIGADGHYAIIGAYWQNADCWAKTNRALAQLPGYPGTITAFNALFQCHLYQTSLGAWDQGFPAGMFRFINEVTRTTRAAEAVDGSPALRFAKVQLLRTIPWLRANQKDDGLWDHEELSRYGNGELNRPPSRRLGTYHIVAALSEFGLLDRLRPWA
jgi:hypothetical protein